MNAIQRPSSENSSRPYPAEYETIERYQRVCKIVEPIFIGSGAMASVGIIAWGAVIWINSSDVVGGKTLVGIGVFGLTCFTLLAIVVCYCRCRKN